MEHKATAQRLVWLLVAIILTAGLAVVIAITYKARSRLQESIKVGVFDEETIRDAELMAIDEINENGVLGKKVIPVMLSADDIPAAEKIIDDEELSFLFGCVSFSCREKMIPVLEKHHALLLSPGIYSMQLKSPLLFSTSATPNQNVIPAVSWSLSRLGRKIFMLGMKQRSSAAVDQAVTAEYIKDVVNAHDGALVGEEYVNDINADAIIDKIIKTQPSSIINLMDGSKSFGFYKKLRARGVSSEKIPTISFYITEANLEHPESDALIGDYAVQSYFQSLDNAVNLEFVRNFKKRYGDERRLNSLMEDAYISVLFWRVGVLQAGNVNVDDVRARLDVEAVPTPEGILSIDKNTQHCWKPFYIGRIFQNQGFGIVFNSADIIQPLRNEALKTPDQWQKLLLDFQHKFGSNQ